MSFQHLLDFVLEGVGGLRKNDHEYRFLEIVDLIEHSLRGNVDDLWVGEAEQKKISISKGKSLKGPLSILLRLCLCQESLISSGVS